MSIGFSTIRGIALLVLAVGNGWLLWEAITWWRWGLLESDWLNIAGLGPNPYNDLAFRWSPLAGWMWANLVEPVGVELWRLAHVAALALLPMPVAAVTLVSGPFWIALEGANMVLFAFVAAWHALAGRRAGIVAFVALAALVPRPIMVPVLLVVLWRFPLARWTFVGAGAIVLVHAVATGMLDDYVGRLLLAGSEVQSTANIAPSRLIGHWWTPIGLALAAWLFTRGRYGLASLAASPYLFAAYLLFGLLELRRLPDHALEHDLIAAAVDADVRRLSIERGSVDPHEPPVSRPD